MKWSYHFTCLSIFLFLFTIGCDGISAQPEPKQEQPESQIELGVRSLDQIKEAEGIPGVPDSPVVLVDDSLSQQGYWPSKVRITKWDPDPKRFLLEFHSDASKTPRFIMQVNDEAGGDFHTVYHLIRWDEKRKSLDQGLQDEQERRKLELEEIGNPRKLTVKIRRIYPDSSLGVSTLYEYRLD